MSPTSKPRLLLLTRPECGLCEEFRAELERQFADRFEVREACVDEEPGWVRRYGLRIPVLLDEDGEVVSAARLDPEKLDELLKSQL